VRLAAFELAQRAFSCEPSCPEALQLTRRAYCARAVDPLALSGVQALLRTTAFFSGSAASAQHEASGSRFGEFHEEWRLVAKNLSELVQIPLSVAEEQVYKYARVRPFCRACWVGWVAL
jgi:hypothetical protein